MTSGDNMYILEENHTGEAALNAIFDDFSGSVVCVDLGWRSYPILIGSGVLGDLGRYLAALGGRSKVVIISDSNVEPLYALEVMSGLGSAQIAGEVISVAAGETSKSASTIEMIYDRLFDFAMERSDIIVDHSDTTVVAIRKNSACRPP